MPRGASTSTCSGVSSKRELTAVCCPLSKLSSAVCRLPSAKLPSAVCRLSSVTSTHAPHFSGRYSSHAIGLTTLPAPSVARNRSKAASAAAGSLHAAASRSPCSAPSGAVAVTVTVTALTGAVSVHWSSIARQRSKSGATRATGFAGRTSRVTVCTNSPLTRCPSLLTVPAGIALRASSSVSVMAMAAAARPSCTSASTSWPSAARTMKSTGSIVAALIASSVLTKRAASVRASTGRRGSSPLASRQLSSPSAPQRRSTSPGSSAASAPAVRRPSETSDSRNSSSMETSESGAHARYAAQPPGGTMRG